MLTDYPILNAPPQLFMLIQQSNIHFFSSFLEKVAVGVCVLLLVSCDAVNEQGRMGGKQKPGREGGLSSITDEVIR